MRESWTDQPGETSVEETRPAREGPQLPPSFNDEDEGGFLGRGVKSGD